MHTALTYFALGSVSWSSIAAACQYVEHPSTVMNSNYALRVPISSRGAAGQNECAATAEAFDITIASIVPGETEGSECVLFGAQPPSACGASYKPMTGATTLSNITGCDVASVMAVIDGALALAGAGVEAMVGTNTTATKVVNTAAVGKAVHSDLSFVTEEDCLVACSQYIAGCTHVTAVVEAGEMVKCSFHGQPALGVQVQGTNTYHSIVPNPQLAARSLGATSQQLGTPPPPPATPADPPANTTAPDVPEEPAVNATLPETGSAPAPAPVPAAAGGFQPDGAVEELLYIPPGACPSPVVTDLPAGKHQEFLEPPEEVVTQYTEVMTDEGKFPMAYGEIVNGGAYCVAKGSTAETVLVGGMFLWEVDGQCVAPPVNAAGDSCCEAFMWQPNSAGFYYDNCSMKLQIQPNGLYYFETEMPGDESVNGWGPDPKPHIHFDIECTGCAGGHPVVDGDYKYWNKLYPEELCTKTSCGDQGEVHQATVLTVAGKTLYKYDFILPATIRTQNAA